MYHPTPSSPARRPKRRRLLAVVAGAGLAVSTLSSGPVDARDTADGAHVSSGTAAAPSAGWLDKLDPTLRTQLGAAGPTAAGESPTLYRVIVNRSGAGAGGDRAIAELSTIDGYMRVITRYRTVDAFSAEVDRAALQSLAEQAEVDWIESMPTAQRTDAEALELTGGDQAHDDGFRGAGSTIAIIDDGIDTSHPAFGGEGGFPTSKVIGGADFGDFDLDPRIDCTGQFHGTPVSGIAAGNGGGVTGAAPEASVVHVKVQSSTNCGSPLLDGDIVGAMDWVVANQEAFDIDVMSMSLGGQSFSGACDSSNQASAAIVSEGKERGIVTLAASGNDADKDGMGWPACLSDVVAVGSVYDDDIGGQFFQVCSDVTTDADQVTCYSNSGSELDILAPSEAAETARAGGGLISFGGTSSATPFAAGVFAVLAAEDQNATPDELIDLVRDTGVDVSDPANGRVTPRVDFVGALNAL